MKGRWLGISKEGKVKENEIMDIRNNESNLVGLILLTGLIILVESAIAPLTVMADQPGPLTAGMQADFHIGNVTENSANPYNVSFGATGGNGSERGIAPVGNVVPMGSGSGNHIVGFGIQAGNGVSNVSNRSGKRVVSGAVTLNIDDRVINKLIQTDSRVVGVIQSLPFDVTAILVNLPRVEQRRLLQFNTTKIEDALSSYRLITVSKDMLFAKRVVSASVAVEAMNKADESKAQYDQLRQQVEENHAAVLVALQAKDARAANKNAFLYMQNAADATLRQLERLKYDIEMDNGISEANANSTIKEIDKNIELISQAKAKVANAGAENAQKWLKDALILSVHYSQPVLKSGSELLMSSKLSQIVRRDELLEHKLECTITAMEDSGKNISNLDELMDEFSQKVADSKVKLNAGALLASQSRLTEAYELVKEIVREVKANGGQIIECPAKADIGAGNIQVVEPQQ